MRLHEKDADDKMANGGELAKGIRGFVRVRTVIPVMVFAGVLAACLMSLHNSPVVGWPAPVSRSSSLISRYMALNATTEPKSVTKDAGPIKITVALVSPRKDSIRVGDMVHYVITCRHEDGTILDSGGSFWYAVLSSKVNPRASTAGRVVDHNNGTYSVYAFAGWAGEGRIDVTRVLNSEAVDFMLNTVWPADDRVVWQGYFNVSGAKKNPAGLCMLRSHGNWSGKCVYPNENALGKTVFLCEKPPAADCNTLFATKSDSRRITARVKELCKGKEDMLKRSKLRPTIQLKDPVVNIPGPPQVAITPLPPCLPDQELPVSQGYWMEGKWQSLLCQITDWTEKSNLTSCLRNKNLLLFGDSTSRQWFLHILDLMGRKFEVRPGDLGFYVHRYYDDIDTRVLISFPKQLVGSRAVVLKGVFYEHDLIDELNDTRCNYIIMVSPWAHFSQWTHESYIDRTEHLRLALIRLRRRCPDAKIVLKGPHPRDHSSFDAWVYSSDVILRGIGEINQRLLGGIGVWFLPIWDMNLAYPGPNTIHMPATVIHEEVKMFLSYVCGDSKMPALKV